MSTSRSWALVVGANRGIGLGTVREFLARGWGVVATARDVAAATVLADLALRHPGQVDIHRLDMNGSASIDGFAAAMKGRTLDMILVNAGVSGPDHRSASAATATEIGALMFTNAIAPIRLSRLLADTLPKSAGVLAFTSSVMGSVALNPGGHELYRASKAALNSLTRGLWGELRGRNITILTLHPGWVRTDMGGPSAAVGVDDSARGMVDVMLAQRNARNHLFLDYTGKPIDW